MPPGSQKRKRSEEQASDNAVASKASPHRSKKSRPSLDASQQSNATEADDSDRLAVESGNTNTDPPANGSNPASQDLSDGAQPVAHFSRPSWTYITDDVLSSWEETGVKELVADVATADQLHVTEIFQELIWSGLGGRLTGQQAGHAIRDIISSHQEDDSELALLFLNTISLLDDNDLGNANLRPLVAATGIDPQIMRQELDIPLLLALGLVRSTFEKMRTRKTTNALYRQANFNLMREESEGYAKLITEFFNTAQDANNRREEDSFMAEDAFQRIKALVGAFDLDVGRVLDITLDVSANLLVKAYPFLMKFYRASSWWPDDRSLDKIKWEDQGFGTLPRWALPGSGMSTSSDEDKAQLAILREARDVRFWDNVRTAGLDAFYEIGTRHIVNFDAVAAELDVEIPAEADAKGKETNPEKRLRKNEARKYMQQTRTLPPSGNFDAAQLLGFKLRFYASDARDLTDVLPDNVVYLAALLIKIGFISLRDLYPHLYPADDAMPEEKSRLEKEKAEKEAKERPGAGSNALAMAAALTDDTLPAPRATRSEKDRSGGATPAQDRKEEARVELPPPQNQKIILLKALLLIGALPEALHILGRFPWLVDVDTSMTQYLHRIAKHMLSKVTDSVRPMGDREGLQDPEEQLADTAIKADARLSFAPRPVNKKSTRWLHNDGFDEHGQEYRHYYADWSDNIPVCQSVDDVFVFCDTFLGYLGVKVGQDAVLYGMLLQIARHSLTGDQSASNRARWLELLKRLLVPALSLSKHNMALADALFEILKLYPTPTRYNLYSEWFKGRTSRQPDVKTAFIRNRAEVRDVLRRVSNDSGKKQSRALAKVSVSSPGVVVMEMIDQLESYSNMIPALVECVRYFSHLAHDVLTWSLINALRGDGRDRIQGDGMLTSSWLQALSQFVATLFARYPTLNPSPVLQYLASELCRGDSTDLAMFEYLLVEMAGIRSDVEFNDYQVIAMAGGEHLQSHMLQQLSDTRHSKKGHAKRLIKALTDPGLIGQLLVAIAQEAQMYSQHEESKLMPLKVLGNNVDKIRAVFAQYLDVLRFSLTPAAFEELVPDTISLIAEFKVNPEIALTMCRDVIRHRMDESDSARKADEQKEKRGSNTQAPEQNGDIAMLESTDDAANGEKANSESTELQKAGDNTTANVQDDGIPGDNSPKADTWHPVLEPIIQRLSEVLPTLQNRVSIAFYVTFWTLTHQDVLVPHEVYKKEQTRLQSMIDEIARDKSDVSAVVARERDKKKKTLTDAKQDLLNEPKRQMAIFQKVTARINEKERFHWFPKSVTGSPKGTKEAIEAKYLGLLQECFLPRALMSSLDAHYSFQMLRKLHDNGTQGFSLMHLLVQLFKKQHLTAMIFECTAVEAQHFGRFLNEVMKLLHWWHTDKANYEKEALNYGKLPGFAKKLDENGEPKSVLDFEEFRRMIFNFHVYLNGALQASFESNEYMHIRNGIIILKSVHQLFPALKFMGQNMISLVTKLSKDDPRQDLKLAAMSLLGPLKNREQHWVLPQAFRMSTDGMKDKEVKPESRAPSAQAEAPQSGATKLSAVASEFKPGAAALSGVPGHRDSVAGREDGEIEDEKQATTRSDKRDGTQEHSAEVKTRSRQGLDTDSDTPETAKQQGRSTVSRDPKPKDDKQSALPAARPTPGSNLPSRPSSTQQSASRPTPTDLPAKLERPPSSSSAGRGGGRPSGRLDERFGRLEPMRDESPMNQSRVRSPHAPAGRVAYRDERMNDRPVIEHRPSRDDLHSASRREPVSHQPRTQREYHDRPSHITRQPDGHAPPERMNHLGSVAVLPDPQPALGAPSTGAGTSRQQPEGAVLVNPDRLSLINESSPAAPSPRGRRDASNHERDQRRERDTRPDDRAVPPSYGNRPNGREPQHDSPARPDSQADLTPTGPKRGRLSREVGSQQESTYGRLNGSADVPSGPRQHNGSAIRGNRNTAAPSPGGHPRINEQSTATEYSRNTDTAGTPRGGPPKQSSSSALAHERLTPSNSTPTTPAAESGPAVHPSRAAQFNQPPPIQTNFPGPGGPRNIGPPSSTGPPSGPRSAVRGPTGTPTGASPTSTFPPSGPALAAQRRSDHRQRANINAALSSGTNGQGVNFRGASTRQSFDGSHPPADTRSTFPSTASSTEPAHDRSYSEDVPPNQSSSRPDLFQDRTNRSENSSNRRRGDDRQYSGRDPGREPRPDNFDSNLRGPQMAPVDDSRMRRGHPRDDRPINEGPPGPRRGPPRTDEQQYRRPQAETPASFVGLPEWDRGSDVRPMRRDGPDDNRRGGRMGGGGRPDDLRGAPRREDDRRDLTNRGNIRDETGPPPHGRKRNHEEGPFDPAKRSRRGGGNGR